MASERSRMKVLHFFRALVRTTHMAAIGFKGPQRVDGPRHAALRSDTSAQIGNNDPTKAIYLPTVSELINAAASAADRIDVGNA